MCLYTSAFHIDTSGNENIFDAYFALAQTKEINIFDSVLATTKSSQCLSVLDFESFNDLKFKQIEFLPIGKNPKSGPVCTIPDKANVPYVEFDVNESYGSLSLLTIDSCNLF